MNIDFTNLIVNYAIMHTIKRKEDNQSSATPVFEPDTLKLDSQITDIIKDRLINAMGKASKFFELQILHDHAGSFYDYCEKIRESTTSEEFKVNSNGVASLLAASQKSAMIPGGYLLVLSCKDGIDNVFIVIKAEPHEALIKNPGESQISLLKSVFLSPSQKLYKIGILSDKPIQLGDDRLSLDKNEKYYAYIFDDQFRVKSQPAEYFYKDFLGFTINANSKIQSQKFYDITERFIHNSFEDYEQKSDLLRVLRDEFNVNKNPSLNPVIFADTFFPVVEAEEYKEDIINELPASIIKDPVLIKNKISRRKVEFKGNIVISGPGDSFDNNVKLIKKDDLYKSNASNQENYTYVRITGRPYSND